MSFALDNADGGFSGSPVSLYRCPVRLTYLPPAERVARVNYMKDPRRVNASNPDGWTSSSEFPVGGSIITPDNIVISDFKNVGTGGSVTFSVDITAPAGAPASGQIRLSPAAGTTYVGSFIGSSYVVPAGTTERVSVTAAMPATADSLRITFAYTSPNDGTVHADRMLLTPGAGTTYFDGDSLDHVNLLTDPRRLDPANPDGWTNGEIGVGGWITGDGFLYSGNYAAPGGSTWTFSASVTAPDDQPLSLSAVVRPTLGGSFSGAQSPSNYTIPAGQTRRVHATATLAPGDDGVRAQLYNLTVTDGTARVDLMVLENAPAPSRFFTGTDLDQPRYRWTGTPGASTSEEYTGGGTPSPRFTGRIATRDLVFPAKGHALTSLTATDELAWNGATFDTFIDTPGQELLVNGPVSLFRLAGADLSDHLPGGSALAVPYGIDPPEESAQPLSPVSRATGATLAGGQYLRGPLATPAEGGDGVTLVALVRTKAAGIQSIAATRDGLTDRLTLTTDDSGRAVATLTNPWLDGFTATATHTLSINDGRPHVVVARWTNATGNLAVFVDNDSPTETTTTALAGSRADSGYVAVGAVGNLPTLTGDIGNVAVFAQAVPDGDIGDICEAALGGFAGEDAVLRLVRYNRWAGNPIDTIYPIGLVQPVGAYDTDGRSFTECVEAVAVAEDGIAHVNGAGELVLVARAQFAGAVPSTVLTGPGDGEELNMLQDTLGFALDPGDVVNDATAEHVDGTSRATDPASVTAYGKRPESYRAAFESAAGAGTFAQWVVSTEAEPSPAPSGVGVDMVGLDETRTAALMALDLGAVIGWSGLPEQRPEDAVAAGIVTGLSETYTHGELTWEPAVTPNPYADVWVVGDPVYGQIDSTHRLSY